MIVTVTLNPSVDRTIAVDVLSHGQVVRARGVQLHPGGKGVNVTRALHANGLASRAILPVAGSEGAQLVALLADEGVEVAAVRIAGRTRSNISIVEPEGLVTKINEPGASLEASDLEAVLERALAELRPGDWVALCGSLPPGVSDRAYAEMIRRLSSIGVRTAVDTGGAGLLEAAAAGPELISPNLNELARAVGRPIDSWDELMKSAREIHLVGARRVLVTLGSAGALLLDDNGFVLGNTATVEPRNSVGAGDAFLAGFLASQAQGAPLHDNLGRIERSRSLREALAWGAAAVQLPGSQMPTPAEIDLDGVRLVPPDRVVELSNEPLVTHGNGRWA